MPAGTRTPRRGAREGDTAGGGADTRCNPHGRSAAAVSPSDRTSDGALRHRTRRSRIKAPVSRSGRAPRHPAVQRIPGIGEPACACHESQGPSGTTAGTTRWCRTRCTQLSARHPPRPHHFLAWTGSPHFGLNRNSSFTNRKWRLSMYRFGSTVDRYSMYRSRSIGVPRSVRSVPSTAYGR